MNKSVAVNIVFNTKTGEIVAARGELGKLSNATDKANAAANKGGSAFSSLGASIGKLAGIAGIAVGVAALTNAIKNSVTSAIKLNAEYETLSNRLASMVYVNTKNIDTTGKLLTMQEKWALSSKVAGEHLEDLKDAATEMGVETMALADAYSAFASGATKQMDFTQMKESFLALSTAAIATGKPINSLVMGMDNLAQGSVVAGSELGLFLNSIGLSNEVLKEAISNGELYKVIMEKTAPSVEAARLANDTYTKAIARFNAVVKDIQQNALAQYFESIKSSVKDITQKLAESKDKIIALVNEIVNFGKFIYEVAILPLLELVGVIYDNTIQALTDLINSFRSANDELSAFEIVLGSIKFVAVGVGAVFQTISYIIKDFVNVIEQIIVKLEWAVRKVGDIISGGTQSKALAELNAQIIGLENARLDIFTTYDKQMAEAEKNFKEAFNTRKEFTKLIKEQTPTAEFGLVQNFGNKSANLEALKKSTKAQIDTLKSWWETEFTLREKNIEFMRAGKDKELEAEKLRFDKVVSNLNFEIQKKLESGEISLEQANALYAVETRLHEAKMRQIAEYSEAYENLRRNIDSALEENIANALTGKFSSTKDFFKDLFDSMQTSFTQGLAQSMAQAIMSAEVMESFTKTFSTAIEGVSSLFGGAEGGLANVAGASEQSTFTQGLGSALAGAVTGYSFGNMIYNSMNAGYTSKADKWRNAGIGASALAGAGAGAYVGSAFGPWGTAIGGLIGGAVGGISSALGFAAFGQKLEQTGQGIELWSKGTKDNLNASLYADMKETTKKWWKKSTKEWTEYYAADEVSLRSVRSVLASYEYLLEDIGGGVKEISIKAGRYSDYASLANAGAKALINAFLGGLNVDTNAIYSVWASYASSVNKEVSVALRESLQKYVDTGNTFEAWKLEFEGKSAEALKLQADLANKQVDRLLETLGANDITIDNYLNYREQALRQSFDPQTIENINALGEYLISAAEASKKYEEALKDETKTKLNLIDPFLNKVRKVDEIQTSSADTSEKLLVQILSTLKQTLRLNQENQEFALQTQAVRAF